MNTSVTKAKEAESHYLAGVSAKIKTAGNRFLAGTWFKREEFDHGEAVRAAMVDRRIYDRDLYAQLPHGRGLIIRGFQRRWIFGKRIKSVTLASVLAPPGPMLDGDASPPPITLSQVMDHVRDLITNPKVQHVIGVCSPSGFDEDVYNAPPAFDNVKLILISPREAGGWRVSPTDPKLDPRLVKLFDPEDVGQKISRVRRQVEQRSTDLLTGGLPATVLARDLDLPVPLVSHALETIARSDSELRVSSRSGEMILFRGAPSAPDEEDGSMSLAEWIKSLFSKEGEEAKKINVLSERRASLSSRLNRMYEDIGKLEKREEQLLQAGKAATSKVTKRSKAAQISRLRKDISRCNTSAAMLSKQINIISTHIHNLELAQTGTIAKLPSSDELTEAAVNAEEILEQLSASDDLVSGLDVGMAESAMSDDEADILQELEGSASQSSTSPKSNQVADKTAEPRAADGREGSQQAQAE